MEPLLLTITLISGISFILSFIFSLSAIISNTEDYLSRIMLGVIFVIAIWDYSLVLAIIGIVFAAIAGFINFKIAADHIKNK